MKEQKEILEFLVEEEQELFRQFFEQRLTVRDIANRNGLDHRQVTKSIERLNFKIRKLTNDPNYIQAFNILYKRKGTV